MEQNSGNNLLATIAITKRPCNQEKDTRIVNLSCNPRTVLLWRNTNNPSTSVDIVCLLYLGPNKNNNNSPTSCTLLQQSRNVLATRRKKIPESQEDTRIARHPCNPRIELLPRPCNPQTVLLWRNANNPSTANSSSKSVDGNKASQHGCCWVTESSSKIG